MSDVVTVALIGVVPPTIAAVASAYFSWRTRKELHVVKTEINGRMTEFMQTKDDLSAANQKVAYSQGVKDQEESSK